MGVTPRRAARVLLVDRAGQVLLFHGFDPARPEHDYWFTVGGGLAPGEPAAEGAARELAEETGLRMAAAQLGEPVWHQAMEFSFDGQWYRQEQEFFLVRVPGWDVVTDGFDQIERDSIDGYRWWGIEELESTTERFYPFELPDLLRQLLCGGPGDVARTPCEEGA